MVSATRDTLESTGGESFLRLVQRSQRGRLKLYIGYSSGVGKTWQMLQEAIRLREQHIDVAAGFVETHGREDIERVLSELEIIVRKRQTYRGIEVTEMDIDAILQRRPTVALVDDLAHTNVPGSRNTRRHEDVEELLAAGIHVISTLNIQHLESLCETVEYATGIKVKDRLSDRVLAESDEIVNVDISTRELQRRLKGDAEHNHREPDASIAVRFSSENLELLRELTRHELSAQTELRERSRSAPQTPASSDQLMVCLSSISQDNEFLLRFAAGVAGRLNRNWYAVHVQTIAERPADGVDSVQKMLADTFTVARQLGATVFACKGDDIVKTILQFAGEYRAQHIIIGNSGRKLTWWQRIRGKKTIAERLISESRGISVMVLDTRNSGTPGNREPIVENKTTLHPEKQSYHEAIDLVSNAGIIFWEQVTEKEKAIHQLLREIRLTNNLIDEDEALKGLLEREKQGGTYLGEDICIPHARLANLKKPVVAIGVSRAGILDGPSKNSACIMCLLLSPLSDPESHIRMIGIISNMAADNQWRSMMLRATSKKEIAMTVRQTAKKLSRP